MKKILLLLAFISLPQCFAQNSIGSVLAIKPGENYPNNMPLIYKWITNAIGSKQTNKYQLGSGPGVYEFPLTDKKPITISLPGTNGIKLVLRNTTLKAGAANQQSQSLYIDASLPIADLNPHFNPSELNYSAKEYFDNIILSPNVSQEDLMYAGMKLIPGSNKKDNAVIFIDSVNAFYHKAIPYPEASSKEAVIATLEKENLYSPNIYYEMFMADKNAEMSLKKFNAFFHNVFFLSDDATQQIDLLRIYNLKILMREPEVLEFPVTIAKTGATTGKGAALKYACSTINANLDYKNKSLTITITANKEQPAIFTKALKFRSTTNYTNKGSTVTEEWLPVQNESASVKEFIFLITENTITVSAKGNGMLYKLLENKNN